MTTGVPDWVDDVISPARFAPYLRATSGDARAAIRLYDWNSVIAAAFVHPLHYVEVALRNGLHRRLCARFGSDV